MRVVRVNDQNVLAIAAVAGVAASFGPSPTGAVLSDVLVTVTAVWFATWAGASAPWWAGATAGAIAAMTGFDAVPTALGAAAFGVALWLGSRRRDHSEIRAVQAGLTLNALVRAGADWPGWTVLAIGVGTASLLVATGLRRRKSRVRRRVLIGSAVAAGIVVVAGAGLLVAAQGARGDANAAQEHITAGVDHLRSGDYGAAAESFDAAAAAFRSVTDAMNAPWAQPARLVPVMAQNRGAIALVAQRSAAASEALTVAAATIGPDDLRVVDGRVDLDALADIGTTLSTAYDAMLAVRAAIDDVASPWLLEPVESRLDTAADEFDDNIGRVDAAVDALELAPAMLGVDGPRHYFLAFTTPAEARGIGGFMGNYAILTADDGAVAMTEFGRTGDLNRAVDSVDLGDAPADWRAMWGPYGFTNGPGGGVGDVPWSNITISPHFPSTAQVIADLFQRSGGHPIDGVFAVDPYVVQALVRFTGGITVDLGGDETRRLTADNTAEFLIFDQYAAAEDTEARTDALEQVASTVVDELLGGALPGLSQLSDTMAPLLDQGRLVGWMADADQQALIARVGLDGALIDADRTGDGFQIVINNAAANKLDAYLERTIGYDATVYPDAGIVRGEITLTLTNNAPTEGFPDGVIGNYVGDPIGTNRSLVTLYTPHRVVTVQSGGSDIAFTAGVEAGLDAATVYVVLPPGASTTLTFSVAGLLEPGEGATSTDYDLTVRTQPLVDAVEYRIEVIDELGQALLSYQGRLDGTTTLMP